MMNSMLQAKRPGYRSVWGFLNSLHFMEPEGSLPHLQVPSTCPYPEPARSSP